MLRKVTINFTVLLLVTLMSFSTVQGVLVEASGNKLIANKANLEYSNDLSFPHPSSLKPKTNEINTNNGLFFDKRIFEHNALNAKKNSGVTNTLGYMLSQIPRNQWSKHTIRLIVTYGKDINVRKMLVANYGAKLLKNLPIAYITTTLDRANYLLKLKGVRGVYVDNYYQWIDPNWNSTLSDVMTYPSEEYIGARALQRLGINGSGVKIAIIDTGIDKYHPDLDDFDNDPTTNDPKIIAEQSFIDYDGNGINDTDASDEFGHGTHCAGIAAANGILKGVAPGAYLMNARALDSRGLAYVSWVINAINWAIENGANIISMSIGWGPSNVIQLLNEAADAAWEHGVMVVVAAGNSGPYSRTISSPGMASRALTVGASDVLNGTTSWSSRGPSITGVVDPDVIAPGADILSTIPGNRYAVYSGTSMATPAVAGVAALLLSSHKTTNIDLIRSAIISTATDLGRSVFEQGAGLVNAVKALDYLNDPTVFAYPSFTSSSPLRLSPNERFEYQFDVFVNKTYNELHIEPSAALVPYVNVSFIDDPHGNGWIRARVHVIMPDQSVSGKLFVLDGSTVLCSTELNLVVDDKLIFDGNKNTDAGETLSGALPISLSESYYGAFSATDIEDIYSFPVTVGRNYCISIQSNEDIGIILTDENGTMILTTALGLKSKNITFSAISTGSYYVRLIRVSDPIDYHIEVSETYNAVNSNSIDLTGVFNSYGYDKNNNGLYDYLVIEFEVSVNIPGNYYFIYAVSQYRSDYSFNKYIVKNDYMETTLFRGKNIVKIKIEGYLLAESKYSGRYILPELIIMSGSTLQYDEFVVQYITPSYNYDQFETGLNHLKSISYKTENVDGQGNPEIFIVECDIEFNIQDTFIVTLDILNGAQSKQVALQQKLITAPNAPYEAKLVFRFSGYSLMEYRSIVIRALSISSQNKAEKILIYDTINIKEMALFDPLITWQITSELRFDGSKAETLVLTFQIHSKVNSFVYLSCSSDLFSLTNETMVKLQDVVNFVTLISQVSVGQNSLTLELDVKRIAARELMGPFLIAPITISMSEYSLKINTFYVTPDYDYHEIRPPEVYLSKYLGSSIVMNGADSGIKLDFEIVAETSLSIIMVVSLSNYYSSYDNEFDTTISKELTLTEGTNQISVVLGYNVLFDKRYIGELKVEAVLLRSTDGMSIYDNIASVGVIHNVDFRIFNQYYNSYIIDYDITAYIGNDADSLYEGVNITVMLQILKPETYNCTLEISNNVDIMFSTAEKFTASSPGQYNVTLFVPAMHVIRNAIKNCINARIWVRDSTGFLDSVPKSLYVFNLRQFDYVLPITYVTTEDAVPFDKDNDGLFDGINISLKFNVSKIDSYDLTGTFGIYIKSTNFKISDITIETSENFTKGVKTINFVMTKGLLYPPAQKLHEYNVDEFAICIEDIRVIDSIGPFYLYISEFIQGSFNISEFDLKPILSIDNVVLKLKDTTGDGQEDYLIVAVTFTLNKELSGLFINIRIDYSFYDESVGSKQYYFYIAEQYVQPTLGKQTLDLNISLFSLFHSLPESFEAECFVQLSTSSGVLLGSYSTQTYELSITKATETESSITNTNEGKVPVISIIVLLATVTAISSYRKRKH